MYAIRPSPEWRRLRSEPAAPWSGLIPFRAGGKGGHGVHGGTTQSSSAAGSIRPAALDCVLERTGLPRRNDSGAHTGRASFPYEGEPGSSISTIFTPWHSPSRAKRQDHRTRMVNLYSSDEMPWQCSTKGVTVALPVCGYHTITFFCLKFETCVQHLNTCGLMRPGDLDLLMMRRWLAGLHTYCQIG